MAVQYVGSNKTVVVQSRAAKSGGSWEQFYSRYRKDKVLLAVREFYEIISDNIVVTSMRFM